MKQEHKPNNRAAKRADSSSLGLTMPKTDSGRKSAPKRAGAESTRNGSYESRTGKSGFELDAIYARRKYKFTKRVGVCKKAKRQLNRRTRHTGKTNKRTQTNDE